MYSIQTTFSGRDVPEEAKVSLSFEYRATPLFDRLKLIPGEFSILETNFDATEQLFCHHCASSKRLLVVEAGTKELTGERTLTAESIASTKAQ